MHTKESFNANKESVQKNLKVIFFQKGGGGFDSKVYISLNLFFDESTKNQKLISKRLHFEGGGKGGQGKFGKSLQFEFFGETLP